MPFYICGNNACPTNGQPFALPQAGKTFCSQCMTANSLTPTATPVQAPITRTRTLRDSNPMTAGAGGFEDLIEALIAKWQLNLVSDDEAKKVKDYVYTYEKNANRIDREGPVRGAGQVVTHARYRLQVGKATFAGIHMQVNTQLDHQTIQRAWRESVAARRYVEVYLG